MKSTQEYIPALGYHWLTPLYDLLVRRFLPEEMLRGRLVMEAGILPGMRVLDLGCGTGSLAIVVKQSHVFVNVYGLDADPQVLSIARTKARQSHTQVTFEQGLAYQLPFPDGWFDRVITSLVFHHLSGLQKQQALDEVFRVLRPGGKITLLDIGVPHGTYAWLVSQVVRRTERAEANVRGLLPGMIRQSGFINYDEIDHFSTVFGSLSLLSGDKPAQSAA